MAGSLVSYRRSGTFATITLDDGKRNAMSPDMLAKVNQALDQAEQDGVAAIVTGRPSVLSAGFDLKVMQRGGLPALRMLHAGYSLTARLLSFPHPLIAACPGHAYAMGVFMLLSTDYRIGVTGDFTYVANEVAIGLKLPRVGADVMGLRLTPAAFQRATVLAEAFTPEQALTAGFIDRLVPPEDLQAQAEAQAVQLMELDARAHQETKRQVRAEVIEQIRRHVRADLRDAATFGFKRAMEDTLRRGPLAS